MTERKGKPGTIDVKALLAGDEEFLRALVRTALQEVLEVEMADALGAEKGERTPARLGYRSGYWRTLITRIGKLELRVPQDRAGRFSTELFERYQRSERALVAALAEMYVQGVSTRKVKAITEELCGHSFSAASISAINQRLDEALAQFAERSRAPQRAGAASPTAAATLGRRCCRAGRAARRIPRLVREATGKPGGIPDGREAAGHHRDRPRRVASDRSTARLRPRLTQGDVLARYHGHGQFAELDAHNSTGVVAAACTQGKRTQHGKPQCAIGDDQPDAREGQAGRTGAAERP